MNQNNPLFTELLALLRRHLSLRSILYALAALEDAETEGDSSRGARRANAMMLRRVANSLED